MKIFFLVVATVYILYLMFLIIRACSELRNMPYVGKLYSISAFSIMKYFFLTSVSDNTFLSFPPQISG